MTTEPNNAQRLTPDDAVKRLNEMQRQIVCGSRIFGNIADVIVGLKKERDEALERMKKEVVSQAREHWHKICALIMLKMGVQVVAVTIQDVEGLAQGNCNIVLDARKESETGQFFIRLVDDKTAAELARQEGGRTIDN